MIPLTVCYYHVTYEFQSESTLCSLAKWLSVRLRTKWLWNRVRCCHLNSNSLYPVGYAIRSLTYGEWNYCQLEKKKLFVFACHKFQFYGKKFYVFIGHLPLKSIFKRSILKAHPRIKRFLLRLRNYDPEIQYVQGTLLTTVGTLRRASLNDITPEIDDTEIKCYVYAIESNYLISDY